MYPDQSLYPANSVPAHVKRINNALQRGDQIEHAEGGAKRDWYVPIVADAEAGFGGPLNCFELMKGMIEAGAAGVHFEDQLASEKKCGHLGGKVCCLPLCKMTVGASCSGVLASCLSSSDRALTYTRQQQLKNTVQLVNSSHSNSVICQLMLTQQCLCI